MKRKDEETRRIFSLSTNADVVEVAV